MNSYQQRTGGRITYEMLSQETGLSRATLESLASRATYNTTLRTIEKLCLALSCDPGDLLTLADEEQRGGNAD